MQTNRRTFLVASGLTAVSAARAAGSNDIIRVGLIGCGGRLNGVMGAADKVGGFNVLAACDVYEPRRDAMRQRYSELTSTHLDYREVLDRKDIDVVFIATPDHWHVKVLTDAVAAGKDAYVEKPVTHTLEEDESVIRAVRDSKRIVQCGMQQRSWVHFRSAVDLIQGGSIGRITRVRTYWYQNYQDRTVPKPIQVELLDWKRWLGSAPDQAFDEEKYRRWRWFWNFGGGAMTDLFTHWIDVVHWAMNSPAPSLVEAMGETCVFDKWDCPDTVGSVLRYASPAGGFQVSYEGTMVSSIDDGGLEFRGTTGTLKIDRSKFEIYREGVRGGEPSLSERSFQDGTIDHVQNFFNSVRDRKEPNAPIEAGVAAARAGHLANVAMRRNEKVTWPSAVHSV
jgi:predicted dehydrogenase